MGSKERLKRMLGGAGVQVVPYAGRDRAYRTIRLGDAAAGGHALVENAAMNKPTPTPTPPPTPKEIETFAAESLKIADRLVVLPLGRVTNTETIEDATGFDLSGFVRILDNYGIRHTMKQHGVSNAEGARGQIAVAVSDFGMIPSITSEPDSVTYDGKNKIGRDVLVFTKLIDGIGYRYVEEMRAKRRLVATDSMRKKKGPWSP